MKVDQTVTEQIASLRVEMEAKSAQYFELARKVVEDAFSKYVAPIYAAFDGKFTGSYSLSVEKNAPVRLITLSFQVWEPGVVVQSADCCAEPEAGSFYSCYKFITSNTVKNDIVFNSPSDLMLRTRKGYASTPELLGVVAKIIEGMNQVQKVIDELGVTTIKTDPWNDYRLLVNV